ncbi:AI-2E family transporter [Bacillus sp. FJAT-44742]|uniref:AI-2E family transporter n=1 Tax=Bacillus sp. FJAT-44742 TaxID=2014005 RepID=UPI000C249DCC|nr:AI-2E family transporter [Bacillus sp. FJAT-44742]
MERKKETIWLLRILIIVLILIGFYLLMLLSPWWVEGVKKAGKILLPFLLAGLITYLLHPLVDKIEQWKVPRFLSILLIYGLFIGGTVWGVIKGGPYLFDQVESLITQIPEWSQEFSQTMTWIHQRADQFPPALHDAMEEGIDRVEQSIQRGLGSLLESWQLMFDGMIVIFLLPFLVFYLLKDLEAFEKTVVQITPKKWRDEGLLLVRAVDEALGGYIKGQVLVALAVGLITTSALWLIGVPFPVLLGIFAALMELIPYFGAFLGAIPALLVAATVSLRVLIITSITLLIIQQIEGNVLSPLIVGKSVHLHPLLIIFALLLGFEVAGVLGLILAVPVFVIISKVIRAFNEQKITWKTAP